MKRSLTLPIFALTMVALAGAACRAEEAKPAPKPPQAKPGVIAGVVGDERGNVIKDARIRVFLGKVDLE